MLPDHIPALYRGPHDRIAAPGPGGQPGGGLGKNPGDWRWLRLSGCCVGRTDGPGLCGGTDRAPAE